ncbi:MAG: hypothetical protein K6E95_04560 [Lachnospiraceae bacterium]|nr:hypothetical protein [Lachnospiraceae bacterium]
MTWNWKNIVGTAYKTTYHKGIKAWLMLVFVVFLFSYIGITDSPQTSFVDRIDHWIGIDYAPSSGNVELLREHAANSGIVTTLPPLLSEYALTIFDGCTRNFSWVIRFFTLNSVYYTKNLGEVIAALIITAVISILLRIFVMILANLGLYRYSMECRHDRNVPLRRLIAPFHKEYIRNEFKVMLRLEFTLLLWAFTIVGGLYKRYQYSMIPFLLAEDPSITWHEAKQLSINMTAGYKFKMFKTHASVFYLFILYFIPVAGLIFSLPMLTILDAEMYFTLRKRTDIDRSHFIEPLFDEDAYITRLKFEDAPSPSSSETDSYVLKNLKFTRPLRVGHFTDYTLSDFIYMFFVFGVGGWIWECGLYVIRDHMIVNRGTMYGPWIPIYGFGGVLIVFLLDRYKSSKIRTFFLGIGICAALEYLVSFVLEFVFNSSYWNYDEDFLNLNGRICFSGLTAFGIGGLASVYLLAPAIATFTSRMNDHKRRLIMVLLCCSFIADLVICILFGFNSGEGIGGHTG